MDLERTYEVCKFVITFVGGCYKSLMLIMLDEPLMCKF
jgi:hypothetical protein